MNFKLSERIVNSNKFVWMEGMLAYIPADAEWEVIRLTPPIVERWNRENVKNCLPSTLDPATIGCLLHLAGAGFNLEAVVEELESEEEDKLA